MKSLLILLYGVLLMAFNEVGVPYPNPQSSGDELMAKEIVNGTYIAAIDMYIKNVKTGMVRYVHVPDSKVVDTMEGGGIVKNPTAEDIDSGTVIYNRDKMLEDAVLPKKVSTGKPLAQIVSKAMCPQSVEYVGEVQASNNFFVINTSNGERLGYSIKEDNGNYGIYIVDGTSSEKKYELESGLYPYRVGYVNGRTVFAYSGSFYELREDGYSKLADYDTSYKFERYLVYDDGNYYLLGNVKTTTPIAVNVDTGDIIVGDFSLRIVNANINTTYHSIKDNCITRLCVKDGALAIPTKFDKITSKARFDYNYDLTHPFRYNEANGVYEYPVHSVVTEAEYIGSIKEMYFMQNNGKLYYSKDLIKPVKAPVYEQVPSIAKILLTREYFYHISYGTVRVFEPSDWKVVVPRPEYGQEFAKEGMLRSDYNYIGDEL